MSPPDADPMMTREGRVVAVDGEHVVVRFAAESACSACRAAKACAGNTPTRELTLRRPAQCQLAPGDTVFVGVAEASALRATAIAYVTPLTGMLAGIAVASALGLAEGVVAVASLAGLAAGFVTMHRLARRPANLIDPVLLDSSAHPYPKENQP